MTCFNYKKFYKVLLILVSFMFHGCNGALLNPQGTIAIEECSLILISFIMMLFVIIPVICMVIYFSFKYRSTNINQVYKPNWCHSRKIEIVVWTIPVLIVSILALLTWNYSHKLEPKKSIVSLYKPIKIDVIALDWRWLFIYPDYHIGTINEIMFPANRPIVFRITSHSVMNAFFIPSLGSQIYAMPGMITKLNLIANYPGQFKGISSNYSGSGFSNMKFNAISVLTNDTFLNWVDKIKHSSKKLNKIQIFNTISIPNEGYSVEYFSHVKKNLFEQIIDQYSINHSKTIHHNNSLHKVLIENAKVEK